MCLTIRNDGRKLNASLRLSEEAGADVLSVPSPDQWFPVPTGDARAPVLRRRWTPAPSPSFASAPNRWTSVRGDGSVRPVLERHWASGGGRNTRAPAVVEHIRGRNTVTGAGPGPAPSEEIAGAFGQTVTGDGAEPSGETITRVCEGCGKPLVGKRRQAKSHGAACRQRAYRRRKGVRESLGRHEDSARMAGSLSA